MVCFKDISLQQFGRLQACFPVRKTKGGQMLWACWCSCDNIAIVCTGSLTSGHAKSCGCLNREISSVVNVRHGYTRDENYQVSPTYSSWRAMLQRTTNANHRGWHCYGGANPPVKVCDRWLDFHNFLADMGERLSIKLSLGRFGDIGDYCKENCAWQTRKEQGAEKQIKNQIKFLAA